MDAMRLKARAWLNNATKTEFEKLLGEAMFNDVQRKICYWRRAGDSNVSIALRLHCDVSTIDREVRKIYQMVNRIII